MFRLMLRVLTLITFLACLGSAKGETPAPALTPEQLAIDAEIEELRRKLARHPEDVDIKLKLAFRLSWRNRRYEAKLLALEVIAIAPKYWDAHILASRLDAWRGDFKAARQRIDSVLETQPDNEDALTIAANIGLWSKSYRYGEEAVRALLEIKPTADRYYRMAQLEQVQGNLIAAKRYARKALALDPEHKRAEDLQLEITHLRLYAISEAQIYPALPGDARYGYSETFVLAILPGSKIGWALSYEFANRFNTQNHRFGARLNYQLLEPLIAFAYLRGGITEVVPAWTGYLGADYRITDAVNLGGRYTFDKMKWPGTLHRLGAAGGIQVSKTMRLDADYFAGLMRHCGNNDFIQGVRISSTIDFKGLQAIVRYAFGVEVEQPPLPAYLEGRFGDDFCLDELGSELMGAGLKLVETRSQELAAQLSMKLGASTVLQGGYGIQLRFDNTEVHSFNLSVQQSL